MVVLAGYTPIDNPRSGGSAYATDGPSSILLHMTVSMGLSASYVSRHPYPPHAWANPYTGDKWQTVSPDRAAFALYQPGVSRSWTNKKGYTLQTELVGVPVVNQETYSHDQLLWIAQNVVVPQAEWLASIGRPVDLTQVRYHPNSSSSASEYWHGRMSEDEWDSFHGLCAHIDVPYNDHWDCSVERLDLIAQYAQELMGGLNPGSVVPKPSQPSPWEDEEMAIQMMSDPAQGGDGTVYMMFGPWCWAFSDDAIRQAMEKTGTLKPGIARVHQATINGYDYQGVLEADQGTLRTGPVPVAATIDPAQLAPVQQAVNHAYANLAAQNAATIAAVRSIPVPRVSDPVMMPAAPVDRAAVLRDASVAELAAAIAEKTQAA